MNVAVIDFLYPNEKWAKLRRPSAVDFVRRRLGALSKSLGDKPYLDGERFTAGDLMMATVLTALDNTDIVTTMCGLPPISNVARRGLHSGARSLRSWPISKTLPERVDAPHKGEA